MKKILWTVFVVIVIILGIWIWQKNRPADVTSINTGQTSTTTPTDTTTKTFISADNSLSFTYPNILTVSQRNNVITIHHQINFANHDACDFKGTAGTSPTLTDFNVTMQTYNLTIASTAAAFDPSLATSSENIDGTLDISAGTIDPYNIGPFNGYKVTEGVEGCGFVTYYLPISQTRTLVAQKQMIGALSDVADPTNKTEILATPGVISSDQSDQIFDSIIQSLNVR